MGLTDWIARSASRHAHVLVVAVPGAWRVRVAVESAVAARGWSLAVSPADADVLVVCGEPGAGLAAAVDLAWHQMPGPRVRVEVRDPGEAAARLDDAHLVLLDTDHHRHDARDRPAASELGMDHEGMDHEGMDMSPSGIPLAEGGDDRDGLEMDVLRVRLGPVLPYWPAGLVLRCSLQGDVITEAEGELLDGPPHLDDRGGATLARRLDGLGAVLALAGWDGPASEARRLRDASLASSGEELPDGLDRLCRKVRRSRTLRWSLRGLRPLSEDSVRRLGLPPDATGDTYDRLIGLVDRLSAVGADAGAEGTRTVSPAALGRLVTGLDLAAARLVVASLEVHEVSPEPAGTGMPHG